MRTDEITQALECCKDRRCDICVRRYGFHAEESICRLELIEHALHLIGCQKKEIEKQAVNVEALEAGIRREKERADRQSRRIPVTERLPEDDLQKESKAKQIKVLAAYKTGNGCWVTKTQLRRKGRHFWYWGVSESVAYWMPLPELPKE